jgi:hypothetical protein
VPLADVCASLLWKLDKKRKQGSLASPIRANQSDPIAAIDLERHVVEERPAGERF